MRDNSIYNLSGYNINAKKHNLQEIPSGPMWGSTGKNLPAAKHYE
jgi:hypothetical protein